MESDDLLSSGNDASHSEPTLTLSRSKGRLEVALMHVPGKIKV